VGGDPVTAILTAEVSKVRPWLLIGMIEARLTVGQTIDAETWNRCVREALAVSEVTR